MLKGVALALAAVVLLPQTVPALPSLAGRWKLADVVQPAGAAMELVVTENPALPAMSILRHFERGTQVARLMVFAQSNGIDRREAPMLRSAFPGRATQRGSALMLDTAVALDSQAGSAGRHEEVWSLTADTLVVEAVDQPSVGLAKRARLTYVRVRRPGAAMLGKNLVENGTADRKALYWIKGRDATVEDCDGNPCFTVRSGAGFQQQVLLPEDAAGKYIVLIGSGASERIAPEGQSMTGIPYLYALVGTEDGTRIVAHLQSPSLRGESRIPNQWVRMAAVFPLPAGSSYVAFDLNQSAVKGIPQNGSAARVDDLGVHVFATESEAHAFIAAWRGRAR